MLTLGFAAIMAVAPAPVASESVEAPVARPRGFVMSGTLGVTFLPIWPVPSGELSLFLGGAMPIKTYRPSHWLALGYRGTLGVGHADILTGGLVAVRHHLAIQGTSGRRGRLYYGASAGFVQFPGVFTDNNASRHSTFALEGEGRIGGLFGSADLRFLFGLQIRLTGGVGEVQSDTVIPTLGLFFGVNFGPRMRAGGPRVAMRRGSRVRA